MQKPRQNNSRDPEVQKAWHCSSMPGGGGVFQSSFTLPPPILTITGD
jgi:hypothetical protein